MKDAGRSKTMGVFEEKLAALPSTINAVRSIDLTGLAAALRASAYRTVYAVGSGGSLAVAEFLKTCRSTLNMAPTIVQTPMELVVETGDLHSSEVWLFSARGENADVHAAFMAARQRGADAVRVVTINPDSRLVNMAREDNSADCFVLPVGAEKDGFLATHSVASTVAALCFASDALLPEPLGSFLMDSVESEVVRITAPELRASLATAFASLSKGDTVLLVHDPRLSPAAIVLETSLWEAAICPVQRTDIRNFAHGRHVWLAHRAPAAFVVAFLANDSLPAWSSISVHFSAAVRRAQYEFGNAGRYENAVGMMKALTIVEAMGCAVSIDPGKPGAGHFAGAIYESDELVRIAASHAAPVRQKLRAVRELSSPRLWTFNAASGWESFRSELRTAELRGLVLDYDGTIVTTERRLERPGTEVVGEITRLLEAGFPVGIATGRGGSAGEMLREVLPSYLHDGLLLGYYNGACILPLSTDLRQAAPEAEIAIAELIEWLSQQSAHVTPGAIKNSRVQLSITLQGIVDRPRFEQLLRRRIEASRGTLRAVASGHSIDITLAGTSKSSLVSAIRARLADPLATILCVGDRGAEGGNDHVLLSENMGISVGDVAGGSSTCWSLSGDDVAGPAGLHGILSALVPISPGVMKLDVDLAIGGTERQAF